METKLKGVESITKSEMETLFSYNTRLSFGLGAEHFSVKKQGVMLYFYGGTPMHPKLIKKEKAIESVEKDIRSSLPGFESADYLKYTYCR